MLEISVRKFFIQVARSCSACRFSGKLRPMQAEYTNWSLPYPNSIKGNERWCSCAYLSYSRQAFLENISYRSVSPYLAILMACS